jgi:trimethylamine---corrinoid protein Co-methyltransferase
MITGTLRLFTESDLDRLHAAVLKVLELTGLRVCSEPFLDALARSGANVDKAAGTAKFPPDMVESMVVERCRQPWTPERERAEPGPEYKVGLSGVIAPHFYDYDKQIRRTATRQDLLDTIHWAEVDLSRDRSVDMAVTMSDVDQRVEPIEAYALLLEHTSRPGKGYSTSADQIPYLVDLATAYYGYPVFPRGPDFITSPLTFTDRLAEYLLEAIRFGERHFGLGVMPICGGNAPMTIAGNIVLAMAEGLGAALVVRSLAPNATFYIAPCNGIIDMRRGTASFNAPEALLADLGVCELFNHRYGGGANVAAQMDYVDGAIPGIQVAHERTYRAMAIAAFVGEYFDLGGQGTLDAGQMFSPVQFIFERDLSEGLWRFGQGIEVNDETIGLEVIQTVQFGKGKSYLENRHTMRHFRETWFPRFLYRGEYGDDAVEHGRDRQMLDAANQQYKDALTRYVPPEIDKDKLKEIRKIVKQAQRKLLI